MYKKLLLSTLLVFIVVLLNGCSANEPNQEGIPPKLIEKIKAKAKRHKHDPGYMQRGYYRIVTQDSNEYYHHRPGDPNKYGRPLLNYEDLPDVNGNTMTIKTSIGDVNVEYQYCLYDDRYDPYDPCSDPNQIMDWVIEKVDKVVPMPHVDTSGFYWGGYYVMQWKIKRPPDCKALDSFVIWQPNNVGIFMKKYAESDSVVYYVSNPILPTMYREMAGTYIGNDVIYSLLAPESPDANEIPINCEKIYHPADLGQKICIENHCYQHCYFLLSCY